MAMHVRQMEIMQVCSCTQNTVKGAPAAAPGNKAPKLLQHAQYMERGPMKRRQARRQPSIWRSGHTSQVPLSSSHQNNARCLPRAHQASTPSSSSQKIIMAITCVLCDRARTHNACCEGAGDVPYRIYAASLHQKNVYACT